MVARRLYPWPAIAAAALIAFPIARYMALHATGRLKATLYLLVMLPLWSSYLVRVYAWKLILAKEGINSGFIQWPLALILSGLFGLGVGALSLRTRGVYFIMITLAFAQMIYFLCVQMPFTGGEDGLQGITRRPLLGGLLPTKDDRVLYYVVLAIFLFGYGCIYRFIHSPFGQVLKAIRDNEQRAVSLGYEADRYKLLAFVLSAAIAGLAGATKAMVLQFATLTDVSAAMSGEVVLMALVGGLNDHRPDRWRLHHHHHAELSRFVRRVRAGDPGHDLRGDRHGLPPRPGRGGRGLLEIASQGCLTEVLGTRVVPADTMNGGANFRP